MIERKEEPKKFNAFCRHCNEEMLFIECYYPRDNFFCIGCKIFSSFEEEKKPEIPNFHEEPKEQLKGRGFIIWNNEIDKNERDVIIFE